MRNRVSEPSTPRCAKCSHDMPHGAQFCTRCGAASGADLAKSETRLVSGTAAELGSGPRAVPRPLTANRPKPPPLPAMPAIELSMEEIDEGFGDVESLDDSVTELAPVAERPEVAPPAAVATPRDDALYRARSGRSLRQAVLRGLDLAGANLEGVDFSRADMDGANLSGAKLKGASFHSASLRGAVLEAADLSSANLDRADLADARLAGAVLDGANLRRVCLERADLSGARFVGSHMVGAELGHANLERADLHDADLASAELAYANLSQAQLIRANLRSANLTAARLDGANLRHAVLLDATLSDASAVAARLDGATLQRAKLHRADLSDAGLAGADCREVEFDGATLARTMLSGARVSFAALRVAGSGSSVQAEWLEAGELGAAQRLEGEALSRHLNGGETPSVRAARYFGRGDILRNALLEFEDNAEIHVESRLENCTIRLGRGAELVIGEHGLLLHCQVSGHGKIVVHGCFFERHSPGISGPTSLVVSSRGAISAAVEQPPSATLFAFERGCQLRLKILPPLSTAAE